MINKIDFDEEIGVFLDEDVEVLETFAKFVGEKLHASTLLSGGKSKARSRETGACDDRRRCTEEVRAFER